MRLNCVSPGVIDTQMNSDLTSDEMEQLIGQIPIGRIGYPEDVAKAKEIAKEIYARYK